MRLNKGFTLMELLIVIGVLAILAAGLLAAIDPFEQLKKARDANNRNATIETINAFTRYYATHGDFPWNQSVLPDAACDDGNMAELVGGTGVVILTSDTNLQQCMTTALITNDGELKTTFFDGLSKDLYLSSIGDVNLQVCFAPESRSQRNDTVATSYYYDGSTVTKVDRSVAGNDCDADIDNCMQCYQ